MKKTVQPWVLVLTGILFNILAAVITHFFIHLNQQRLDDLNLHVQKLDTLIDSQWRLKTEIDRKQEFYRLLLNQSALLKEELALQNRRYIREQLQLSLQQTATPAQPPLAQQRLEIATVEALSEQIRRHLINSINDTYLDKLTLEKKQNPIRQSNARLYTVAIFLQVVGLILVLARDLRLPGNRSSG